MDGNIFGAGIGAFHLFGYGVLVLLVLVLAMSVRIVQQSDELVITRLGRYHRTLGAGVSTIIPFIESVHQKVSIADKVLPDVRLDVVSKDNVVFGMEIIVVYRITEAEKAVFRVNSVDQLVIGLVKSLVRSEIGKRELDAIQEERQSLNAAIKEALEEAGKDYGVLISRSEITDVQLQETTQRVMQEVLEAERVRRATETRAAGAKRATELAADAALYEAQKKAEAVRVGADATAYANRVIGDAIKVNGPEPANFQIAERQIDAVTQLAQSTNAKIVMVPGDVTDGFTRAAVLVANNDRLDKVA